MGYSTARYIYGPFMTVESEPASLLESRSGEGFPTEEIASLSNQLTQTLVGERMAGLLFEIPELQGVLQPFEQKFFEATQDLLHTEDGLVIEAFNWFQDKDITGQLGEIQEDFDALRTLEREQTRAFHEVQRSLKKKQRRVIQRGGPEDINEAFARLKFAFEKAVLQRDNANIKFPLLEMTVELERQQVDETRQRLAEIEGQRTQLSAERQQLGQERTKFENRLQNEHAAWAVKDSQLALAFGLLFPAHIDHFMAMYTKRIRGEPHIDEIHRYLDWIVEEATSRDAQDDLALWLGDTPWFTVDLAQRLLQSFDTGDEENNSSYSSHLEEVSSQIIQDWGTQNRTASPFRDHVLWFHRRELLREWQAYGSIKRLSVQHLDLPFVGRGDPIPEEFDIQLTDEIADERLVILHLPDGTLIEDASFGEDDLGMQIIPRGLRHLYAEHLRMLMHIFATREPHVSMLFSLPHPIEREGVLITHRFKPTRKQRILAGISYSDDGHVIVQIYGGGPREGGKVYRQNKLQW